MAQVNGRRLMRPPYGRRRPGTVRVLWEEGYIPILWSVTLWDWNKGVTTEKIMRKAEADPRRRRRPPARRLRRRDGLGSKPPVTPPT